MRVRLTVSMARRGIPMRNRHEAVPIIHWVLYRPMHDDIQRRFLFEEEDDDDEDDGCCTK